MSESLKRVGPAPEHSNVYHFLTAKLEREVAAYNASQPTELGVKGDDLVYPGEPVESNIEVIKNYAKEVCTYWSTESERARIQAGEANLEIDRSQFDSFRTSVSKWFGNDPLSLYKTLDRDRKAKETHGSHMLEAPYLVAVAERFLELLEIPKNN